MGEGTARIVSLYLCEAHRAPMKPVNFATAVADLGLEGDRHARAGSKRQVLLMQSEVLAALGLRPGDVRENITTAGVALMELALGEHLRLGEDVVLEVTGQCHPCFRMDEIRLGLQAELAGRRGITARVVEGGAICVGDEIVIAQSEAQATGVSQRLFGNLSLGSPEGAKPPPAGY